MLFITCSSPAPPEETSSLKEETTSPPKQVSKNVMQTLVSDPTLTTFVMAVKNLKMVGYLSGNGPFTVFAPTNEAFAALPEEVVTELFSKNQEDLEVLIKYHILAQEWYSKDMIDDQRKKTLNGVSIRCDRSQGLMINGGDVLESDIITSNGIIHIVDAILLPED